MRFIPKFLSNVFGKSASTQKSGSVFWPELGIAGFQQTGGSASTQKSGSVFWPELGIAGFQQTGGSTISTRGGARAVTAFGAVFSCVSILSQDVSKLPVKVWKKRTGGGRDEVFGTATNRLLKKPNYYQTWTEFMISVMTSLLYDGNAYCLKERNGRNEVVALYPVNPSRVSLNVASDGSIYYGLSKDLGAGLSMLVPARDVVHLRNITLHHPLIGVTPIVAAAYSSTAGTAALQHMSNFLSQMARPSGVLKSPNKLDDDVVDRLKEQFESLFTGNNIGRTAVFEQGLEWQAMTMSAVDAEIINQLKWSVSDVARVFRMPPFLIGDMEKTSYKNSETMQRVYLSGVLSYYLRLIETKLDQDLDLPDDIILEFDVDYMLRAELDVRIEALGRGVQNGIFAPNEARAREGLNPKPGGDDLYVQQQMVPLDPDKRAAINGTAPAAQSPTPTDTPPADSKPKDIESFVKEVLDRIKIESASV